MNDRIKWHQVSKRQMMFVAGINLVISIFALAFGHLFFSGCFLLTAGAVIGACSRLD